MESENAFTHPDPEIQQFGRDLLESVRQMKAGQAAKTVQVPMTEAAAARASLGLTQAAFARMLGVSVRTLQDWEQGRRQASGAARMLLRIACQSPAAVLQASA